MKDVIHLLLARATKKMFFKQRNLGHVVLTRATDYALMLENVRKSRISLKNNIDRSGFGFSRIRTLLLFKVDF